jgi:glycerol-3-phosphate acyltransferase PlsY
VTSAPPYLAITVAALAAYLIGGLPFGYWFVRIVYGKDVRTMGSGNIGATNVHRSTGGKAGLAVLILDIGKGVLAVWLASITTRGNPTGMAIAAAAVMLGHCYPVFLNFRGGKAVACFLGAFVYLTPLSVAAAVVVFLIVLAASRYVSLASITAALLFPVAVWFVSHAPDAIFAASIFAALLIVYRHRANIARLRNGAEHVFSLKGGKTA